MKEERTMKQEEYVELAVRTEAVPSEGIRQRLNAEAVLRLETVLSAVIDSGCWADALKKKLFYGKTVSEWTTHERSELSVRAKLAEIRRVQGCLDYDRIRLIHAVLGLVTEAAELAEAMYAHLFFEKDLDTVNLAEEGGDIFWYMAVLSDTIRSSFAEMQRKNIAKLRIRQPDKFSEERAINRNLELERRALEE